MHKDTVKTHQFKLDDILCLSPTTLVMFQSSDSSWVEAIGTKDLYSEGLVNKKYSSSYWKPLEELYNITWHSLTLTGKTALLTSYKSVKLMFSQSLLILRSITVHSLLNSGCADVRKTHILSLKSFSEDQCCMSGDWVEGKNVQTCFTVK